MPETSQNNSIISIMEETAAAAVAGGRGVPTEEKGNESTAAPQCYLIIANVSKKKNIGNIVRSAAAFGVEEIIVVGQPKFTTFGSRPLLGQSLLALKALL